MKLPRSVECAIRLKRGNQAKHRLRPGIVNTGPSPPCGRIARVAKLLALAHKFDGLLCQGAIADYAAIARLGQVSRARITQVMNLLYLAPDIQEEILFLAPSVRGRDLIYLRQLQPIAGILHWHEQRARWRMVGPHAATGARATGG